MTEKEIVLTYYLIGDPVQESKDFYYHDGMSILEGGAGDGAKLDIWKGDCVLVKIADSENSDRYCPVLVKGFTEQKAKGKKIKMHLTWFYNKQDVSADIQLVNNFPDMADIRRKEKGIGKSGEELQVHIPTFVLSYLTNEDITQPFFLELKNKYDKQICEKQITPPLYVSTSGPLCPLSQTYAVPAVLNGQAVFMEQKIDAVKVSETEVKRLSGLPEEGIATSKADTGEEGDVLFQESINMHKDSIVIIRHEKQDDYASSNVGNLADGRTVHLGADSKRSSEEEIDDAPAKKPRIDKNNHVPRAAVEESRNAEAVAPKVLPNITPSKKRLVIASPPIFSPHLHSGGNHVRDEGGEDKRMRGGLGTSDTEDWEDEQSSSRDSDSDYRENSQLQGYKMQSSSTPRRTPRPIPIQALRTEDSCDTAFSEAVEDEEGWVEEGMAIVPPLQHSLPELPAGELQDNILFSPFDAEPKELDSYMKTTGKETVLGAIKKVLAKNLPSPLCIEGSLVVLDQDVDSLLLESYQLARGSLNKALAHLEEIVPPLTTIWSMDEQKKIYKMYRDYSRYSMDEGRRKRILHDLHFSLNTPTGGAGMDDLVRPSSSSPLTQSHKTPMQIRNFIALYLHTARSLRAALGKVRLDPPVTTLSIELMKQVLSFIPKLRCAVDDLTCQQLFSSFLVYDQQVMDPFEFLVRAKCILMRGLGDGGVNTNHLLFTEICNMLPTPLNKKLWFPFAAMSDEDERKGTEGSQESDTM
eukprot:gene28215-34070_t